MYTVVIHVYNRFNEIETEKFFRAKTKAAASSIASRWCSSGWCNWRDTFSVKVRDIGDNFYIWELR